MDIAEAILIFHGQGFDGDYKRFLQSIFEKVFGIVNKATQEVVPGHSSIEDICLMPADEQSIPSNMTTMMYGINAGLVRMLKYEAGKSGIELKVRAASGSSAGMWSAMQAAGWFSDDEDENLRIGAEIVAMRGLELSQPLKGKYKIVGLAMPEQEAKELAMEYGTEISQVYTSNRVIMAGEEVAMKQALADVDDRKVKTVGVKKPFHTSHVKHMGSNFGQQLRMYLKQHPEIQERLTKVGPGCDVISDVDGEILSHELMPYAADHISAPLNLVKMGARLRDDYHLPVVSVGVSKEAAKSVGQDLKPCLYYEPANAGEVLDWVTVSSLH